MSPREAHLHAGATPVSVSGPLILASGSPRRTALLTDWGIPHDIISPDVDESALQLDEPVALTRALARLKARHVVDREPEAAERAVLAADTVVALGSRILGKPRDEVDAQATLEALSGRTVQVVTGLALALPGEREPRLDHDVSDVLMRPFDRREAADYVATGEPMGKAGSFAIQGLGGRLVHEVEGSLSNVIGLPRVVTLELLAGVRFEL